MCVGVWVCGCGGVGVSLLSHVCRGQPPLRETPLNVNTRQRPTKTPSSLCTESNIIRWKLTLVV